MVSPTNNASEYFVAAISMPVISKVSPSESMVTAMSAPSKSGTELNSFDVESMT